MISLAEKIKLLNHWVKRKIELIKLSYSPSLQPLLVNMGDVYYVDLGVNIGFEIDKHRPFLIFQNNSFFTKNSNLVFGFPITSSSIQKDYNIPITNKDLSHGNIKDGTVLLSQGRSISKNRIGRKMGKAKSSLLKNIAQEYQKFLYKNTPLEKTRGKAHYTEPEG